MADHPQSLKVSLQKSELLRESMSDELSLLKNKISQLDSLMILFERPPDISFDPSVLRPVYVKDITNTGVN